MSARWPTIARRLDTVATADFVVAPAEPWSTDTTNAPATEESEA